MKVKVNEASGPVLDWMVQEAEFQHEPSHKEWVMESHHKGETTHPYSSDWLWGGPIIEREGLLLKPLFLPSGWYAEDYMDIHNAQGPTPLIAAMRCFVASKLGEEVEVPDELI